MKAFAYGQKFLCIALALIPLIYLIHIISYYSVDVPYWDDWLFIPLLEKSYEGTMTFQDLLAPQAPHRLFFSRIIILGLAHLTGWNAYYQIGFNILLGIGIFAALTYQLKVTAKEIKSHAAVWLIPMFALVVFSLSQWENWTWGWQIAVFLNAFSVVAGIIVLAGPTFKWLHFIIANSLGIIAIYSFSIGFIYWPIGLYTMFFSNWPKKTKWLSISLWSLVGFLVIYTYICDYPNRGNRVNQAHSVFKQPLGYITFTLQYLGAPIIKKGSPTIIERKLTFFIGLISLIATIALVLLLIRIHSIKLKIILPWISLSIYAIGSGFMTSIGRLKLEGNSFMSSRYMTISSLYWISIIMFLYLLARYSHMIFKTKVKERISRWVSIAIIIGLSTMVILNSIEGARVIKIRSYHLRLARNELLFMENQQRLKVLGPYVTIPRVNILKKRHLSVFRER